jgi:hypothetical protein
LAESESAALVAWFKVGGTEKALKSGFQRSDIPDGDMRRGRPRAESLESKLKIHPTRKSFETVWGEAT